jgi:hypothetical protein
MTIIEEGRGAVDGRAVCPAGGPGQTDYALAPRSASHSS